MEQYAARNDNDGGSRNATDNAMLAVQNAIDAVISAARRIPVTSAAEVEKNTQPLAIRSEDQSLLKESALLPGDSVLDQIQQFKRSREERKTQRQAEAASYLAKNASVNQGYKYPCNGTNARPLED